MCSKCNFSLTNEYPNIFVASKSNQYLPKDYICLKIFEYSNIFKHLQCKNSKKSINECPNIFVALKSYEYLTNECNYQ